MRIEAGQRVIAEARIRALRSSDFASVIAVIDEWWGDAQVDGIPVTTGYGPGQDRVRFVKDHPPGDQA